MQKIPLSLVLITLNEESNIERCIKSAPFVSEVVLVDSGSQDRTLEIAQKICQSLGLELKVYQEAWRGFGPQKHRATELASQDWILNLDADEALSPELQNEILQRFSSLRPEVGYCLPRKSFYLGRWILHGGWYPDLQLRLFHRRHSQWSKAQIHEAVEAKQKENFTQAIEHYVFRDMAQHVATNNRYSGLLAAADHDKGKKFSLLRLIFKPHSKFIECYFLKMGFRDGLPGFVIAVGAAYSIFLRVAKLWELEMKNEQQTK